MAEPQDPPPSTAEQAESAEAELEPAAAPGREGDQPAGSCLHCGTPLVGVHCHRCGQRRIDGRLTLRRVGRDLADQWLQLDSALGATLTGLFLRPGPTAREFVEGHRVRFVNPVRYFLATLALYLLVGTLFPFDPVQAAWVTTDGPELQREATATVSALVTRHFDLFQFLVVPLFALLLRALYRSAGHNFAEILVLVLFVTGHLMLVSSLLLPLGLVSQAWMVRARQLVRFAYLVWAVVGFFRVRGSGPGLGRAVVAYLLYMGASIAVATTAVLGWLALVRWT